MIRSSVIHLESTAEERPVTKHPTSEVSPAPSAQEGGFKCGPRGSSCPVSRGCDSGRSATGRAAYSVRTPRSAAGGERLRAGTQDRLSLLGVAVPTGPRGAADRDHGWRLALPTPGCDPTSW